MDLGGRSVLARVVERARMCARIHDAIVATSTLSRDDEVASECERIGVACFRGNEEDVLDRFQGAANAAAADTCVRITADCPLLDPSVSDEIIARFEEATPTVDYTSNKIPQSFPRGLDTEVFSRAVLEVAAREATEPYERVHVTPYFYRNPDRFRLLSVTSDVDRADWRWTVDTPEDLEFVRTVYHAFGDRSDFGWLEVVALIEREPALAMINQHVVQKSLELG